MSILNRKYIIYTDLYRLLTEENLKIIKLFEKRKGNLKSFDLNLHYEKGNIVLTHKDLCIMEARRLKDK